MNDRNTTRKIVSFKDYCLVMEQRKREFQDQSARAGKEENRSKIAEMRKTRTQ